MEKKKKETKTSSSGTLVNQVCLSSSYLVLCLVTKTTSWESQRYDKCIQPHIALKKQHYLRSEECIKLDWVVSQT